LNRYVPSLLFFNDDDLFAFVNATVRADMVGQDRFVTLRTKGKGRGGQFFMGPAFVSP
jgi:hypothetical protein